MTEPTAQQEDHQPVFSKRAAYGLSASAVLGTATLAVTSPQTLAAGVGSVGMSSAVFVTPVWRFIKRINDMYTDISMYMGADWEMIRGKHFGPTSIEKREALAKHKPTFSRPAAYGVLAATGLTSAFLAVYAPSVLAAAFGSVIVSGASFTKPVIDLVRKVNELYVDTYNYVKGDLSKTKKVHIKPLAQDTNHEIDQSIYAPVEQKRKYSKKATYAILAGAAMVGGLIALGAPSLLVAAAGTIIGSAISYTAPALKFVKKVNHVYDKTEDHIIEDLDIADKIGPKTEPSVPQPKTAPQGPDAPLHITKPMAYAIAAATLLGGAAVVYFVPSLITAAIGGILGSASSFTTPVLKQVGKVNAFYIDACEYMKEDWQRIKGPKPTLPLQKPGSAVNVAATVKPSDAPKVESPKEEFNKVAAPVETPEKPATVVEFNKSAQPPVLNDNKPQQPEVSQPAATVQKPKTPGNTGPT